MNKYKYLLFDADNTIFDFSKAEYNAFRITCEKCGVAHTDELYKIYSDINNSLWKKFERGEIELDKLKTERFCLLLVGALRENDTVSTFEKAEKMREIYMHALAHQAPLIEGAEETVCALSKKCKLCLITNGVSSTQRTRFSLSDITGYFEEIFISEEIGFAKPAREYFDHVIEKIGDSDRSKYLVIGDSLTSDCDGAISSGIDICRYNPKNEPSNGRKLTYNIKELKELLQILL